ncbi:MAG TPA: alkaline phosphatase [Candidatus Binatia bacterium]|nr:alkaline phosphatase [Candidatus Binatia bacterium]
MKVRHMLMSCVVAAALALAGAFSAAAEDAPKYIFIFLADGGSVGGIEIARSFNRVVHREGFTITDKIMREGSLGLLTTEAADSLTTDSAAAATALSGGCKANIGALGICADGRTVKTVMERAREKGFRAALVTTSTVYDASPAAFLSHVSSRKDFEAILDQYLRAAPDLILGGGREQFLPAGRPESARKDGKDRLAEFTARGYAYASDKTGLAKATGAKLLGLFTPGEMNFDLDRAADKEPSLVEMTRATIRFLGRDGRGFMAFIENENTDTAGHLTDVASMIHAYRDFDGAVALAYEFYLGHPRETLILVTSDHDSGGVGFTLALEDLRLDSKRVAANEEVLKKIATIPISLRKAAAMLGPRPTAEAVDRVMRDVFKGFTLAPDLKKMLLAGQPPARNFYTDPAANVLGMMIANNTQVYWGSGGHTHQPVFVAALGAGAERFRGYQDNTDFAKHLFALLGDSNSK